MRFFLYLFVILFSFILFALTAARLHYTTHLRVNDPLNNGFSFYDPVVAELCATSILLIIVAIFFAFAIRRRYEHQHLTRHWFEVLCLTILWFMLLIGAANATSIWPNLSFCDNFQACQVLQAMLAFAWLTWIGLTVLLLSSIFFAASNRAWGDHVHQFYWRRHDKEMTPAAYAA